MTEVRVGERLHSNYGELEGFVVKKKMEQVKRYGRYEDVMCAFIFTPDKPPIYETWTPVATLFDFWHKPEDCTHE